MRGVVVGLVGATLAACGGAFSGPIGADPPDAGQEAAAAEGGAAADADDAARDSTGDQLSHDASETGTHDGQAIESGTPESGSPEAGDAASPEAGIVCDQLNSVNCACSNPNAVSIVCAPPWCVLHGYKLYWTPNGPGATCGSSAVPACDVGGIPNPNLTSLGQQCWMPLGAGCTIVALIAP